MRAEGAAHSDASSFYDDIAEHYDLIFADWEASMARQGSAIAQMIEAGRDPRAGVALRVLDVSAGIGTQSLPLARLGYAVTARDVSPKAIARLHREAFTRGLAIEAAVCDMRTVAESVDGPFDVVISFDNSLPHLLDDGEIRGALEGFRGLLRPGGRLLVSVRDYRTVDRSPTSDHSYGERTRDGRTFHIGQRWRWLDADHYRTTMMVEERDGSGWREVVRTEAVYYAVPIDRLLQLMHHAGFESCAVSDVPFYQPVLTGTCPRGDIGGSA